MAKVQLDSRIDESMRSNGGCRTARNAERSDIREHVAGVGQQREGIGEPSSDRFGEQIGSGQHQRQAQAPRVAAAMFVTAVRRGDLAALADLLAESFLRVAASFAVHRRQRGLRVR